MIFQGLKFDWTISLGNILAGGTFFIMCVLAWRDLIWRIKNLETWRREHMVDSDSRDKMMSNFEKVSGKLEFIIHQIGNRGIRHWNDKGDKS